MPPRTFFSLFEATSPNHFAISIKVRWLRSAATRRSPISKFACFGGFLAWLRWLFVHLTFLIGLRNRLLVLSQWTWAYFAFGPGPSPTWATDGTFLLRSPSG